MKIILVSVSLAEIKTVAEPFGEAAGKAFVDELFGPMIETVKPKKKVKK